MEMDIAALLPILHLPLHLPWSALLLAHSARAASSFAAALAAATWKGMLLAMLVALCLRLLPQITAPARSIVWTTVFALIVLLHFAPLPSAGAAHAGVAVDQRWSLGIAGLWVLLSLHRAVQLGAGAARLGRLARRATPVDCGRACAHLLARTSRKVQVCTTEAVDRPSLAGFFSPRILLPPSLLAALSAAELEQILLHETEHLRRRDDWT
ncbi:MAG TPA: M56 family metallopeptidase, partial [Acidobacteriaceae bacterium]